MQHNIVKRISINVVWLQNKPMNYKMQKKNKLEIQDRNTRYEHYYLYNTVQQFTEFKKNNTNSLYIRLFVYTLTIIISVTIGSYLKQKSPLPQLKVLSPTPP